MVRPGRSGEWTRDRDPGVDSFGRQPLPPNYEGYIDFSKYYMPDYCYCYADGQCSDCSELKGLGKKAGNLVDEQERRLQQTMEEIHGQTWAEIWAEYLEAKGAWEEALARFRDLEAKQKDKNAKVAEWKEKLEAAKKTGNAKDIATYTLFVKAAEAERDKAAGAAGRAEGQLQGAKQTYLAKLDKVASFKKTHVLPGQATGGGGGGDH